MADLGQIGVLALSTPLISGPLNANIPAKGQIGSIAWETATNIGFTISGVVLDSSNAPLQAVVHLLTRSTSSDVVASVEMSRVSDPVTGAYIFAVGTQTPRAVLVFDNSSPHINSILLDKVVPG